MKKLLLLIACVAMIVGCSGIKDIIPIPSSFLPSYSVVEATNISLNDAPMMRIKIILPKGLTESEIRYNCRSIVLETYAETDIRNITIFAYENKNEIAGAYTIAQYEFCPFGNWSRTNEVVADDKYKENYSINHSYFGQTGKDSNSDVVSTEINKVSSEEDKATIKKKSQPSKGDKIALATDTEWDRNKQEFVPAKTTKLSDSPTDFSEERVVKIKNGTKATITDIYSQTMTGGSKWVAYKVELSNKKTGWVLAESTTLIN